MKILVEVFSAPGCAKCAQTRQALRSVAEQLDKERLVWRDVNVLDEMDYAVELGVLHLLDGLLVRAHFDERRALVRRAHRLKLLECDRVLLGVEPILTCALFGLECVRVGLRLFQERNVRIALLPQREGAADDLAEFDGHLRRVGCGEIRQAAHIGVIQAATAC